MGRKVAPKNRACTAPIDVGVECGKPGKRRTIVGWRCDFHKPKPRVRKEEAPPC